METVDTYIQALKNHDWWYDYSDDFSVWRKGNKEIRNIRRMQPTFDPDCTLWNKYAPKELRCNPLRIAPKKELDGEQKTKS